MATPQFIKNFSRNGVLRGLTCYLGSLYIRLVYATGRWQVENAEKADQLVADGKTFVSCFWHGRLMMMPYAWPYPPEFNMLISSHADGQLIAKTVSHLGIRTIEGSTKRGGGAALRAMVRALKGGEYIGITPDGPRGPRMRASDGAIALAKLTGVPVLPISYSVTQWKMFSSWDRFVLPLPFSKGVYVWGEPIEVSRDADEAEMEAKRQQLEATLIQVTKRADDLTGQITPEPAEAEAPA